MAPPNKTRANQKETAVLVHMIPQLVHGAGCVFRHPDFRRNCPNRYTRYAPHPDAQSVFPVSVFGSYFSNLCVNVRCPVTPNIADFRSSSKYVRSPMISSLRCARLNKPIQKMIRPNIKIHVDMTCPRCRSPVTNLRHSGCFGLPIVHPC